MTASGARRRTVSLLIAGLLAFSSIALAGCLGQDGEEAGGPTPTTPTDGTPTPTTPTSPEDEPAWDEFFEVTENATVVHVNSTVRTIDGSAAEFEACILDPDGNVVASRSDTTPAAEDTFSFVNFTIGPAEGGNATDGNETDGGGTIGESRCGEGAAEGAATADPTAGRWRFVVWSDANLLVTTAISGADPDAEASA